MSILVCEVGDAAAATHDHTDPELARIEAVLSDQARQIAAQNDRISRQQTLIADQQGQLDALLAERAVPTEIAMAPAAPSAPSRPIPDQTLSTVTAPEGAPETGTSEDVIRPSLLAAIPQGMGVLTPRRRFVFEPSVEYDRTGANTQVFGGVDIIPALPASGPVDAATAVHDVVEAAGTVRYGLSDRAEIEARVPFVYRSDRLSSLGQAGAAAGQGADLNGSDIGDIQLAVRYQINASHEGQPTFVANLQARAPTGRGPYDVDFQADGSATNLATGAGFWGLEPSITLLLPTDPIVIFANVGYLKNFSRDINKTIGFTRVGSVNPGDAIDTAIGFGLALNPKFSFSLGYSNEYIFGASRNLDDIVRHSRDLELGALIFGWSYKLRSNLSITTNFQFGVTPDAPDLRFAIRLPISF